MVNGMVSCACNAVPNQSPNSFLSDRVSYRVTRTSENWVVKIRGYTPFRVALTDDALYKSHIHTCATAEIAPTWFIQASPDMRSNLSARRTDCLF